MSTQYNTIPQQVQQDADAPTRSGNSCLSCWCWTVQILVWASLVGGVIAVVYNGVLEGLYAFGAIYVIYIITELCSPTFSYLRHQKGNDRMYEKMGELFRTAPIITFRAQCYHYETRHHSHRDSKGHIHHSTERVRVNTHFDSMNLPYYSARDVSGLFLLDIDRANVNKKAFIKLHLQKEINFADSISYADYIYQKEAFWQRNRYRDVHMDFSETREIPGFHTHNLVQIGDYHPGGVSACLYVLWTFLMVAQFYKRYVDSFCVFQNYKIRKIISTRYNLLLPDYGQQYAQISPALNLTGTLLTYEPNNVGYCSSNYQVQLPTQEELDKAKQYENSIPHYAFSSVGGDCNYGVVQDLPQFEEVNYNQPPPAFANLGGEVSLSESQIVKPTDSSSQSLNPQANANMNMGDPNMNVNPNMNAQMNVNPNMNVQMNVNPNMNVQMNVNPNMNQGYNPPIMPNQGYQGFQG